MDFRRTSIFHVFMKQVVISQLDRKTITIHINALLFLIIAYIINIYIL